MGDGDPGYYFNMGYHLAATGEMTIYDKSIPAMSDTELKTFYAKDYQPVPAPSPSGDARRGRCSLFSTTSFQSGSASS